VELCKADWSRCSNINRPEQTSFTNYFLAFDPKVLSLKLFCIPVMTTLIVQLEEIFVSQREDTD
jgi:hypothetical protein